MLLQSAASFLWKEMEPGSQTHMPTADLIPRTAYHRRRANNADEGFLLNLYAQERAAELMLAGLDATQRQMFVQMQFGARQASYAANYPTAMQEIICAEDGMPAGGILVERTADGMRLIDIAVINGKRGQGLGTEVIRALQQECDTRGLTLKLQVLKGNTAEKLYRRLGFEVAGEDSLRRQMVWSGAKD
jgi:ribosomal protein S18 acetylase RimI-like enzyme